MKLNKFEIARIIGARALQLSMGAPPLIEIKEEINSVEVAFKEFKKGIIPLVVVRE